MKKIISVCLIVIMLLSLVGCSNEPKLTKTSNGVELPAYTNLDVVKTEYIISEEFIDYQLEEIAKQYSSMEKIKEGVVKDGDIITVSYNSYIGEQLLEDASNESITFTIGEETFSAIFEDSFIGLNIGEEFEFVVEYPAESTYSILDGKAVTHKGKIEYVSEMVYPKITDSFIQTHVRNSVSAKEASCRTVEEYREYLRERYEFVYKQVSREALLYDILDLILKDAVIPEIPVEKLDEYENGQYSYYIEYCTEMGFSIESYLSSQNITEEEFRASLRKDGELIIKQTWILQAVEELEKITLSEERYNEYLNYLVEYYQFDDLQQLKDMIAEIGSEDIVRSDAKYEAIYDYLLANQKITIEKVDLLEKTKAGELN